MNGEMPKKQRTKGVRVSDTGKASEIKFCFETVVPKLVWQYLAKRHISEFI